ncbi:MAG: hypothetical protein EBY15_01875 [Gammaproteobacteria bacterium]|nr:hypothetical protein [Gammaproteobacteria bacterium]
MSITHKFFSSSLVAAIVFMAGLQPSQGSIPEPTGPFSTIDPVNIEPPIDPNPPVDPNTKWTDVGSGITHSCGILNTGALLCWGNNDYGQTTAPKGAFRSVSAGGVQSCGITKTGRLKCWGSGHSIPKKSPMGKFLAVSAGDVHTCAIAANHRVRCWGENTYQQARAPSGKFESISAGGRHTCGVKTDGGLACWGESSFLAAKIPAGSFNAVSTGEDHACAIRNDSTLICWGNNAYGQADAPAGQFKSVTATEFNTCGLGFDGAFQCWGRDLLTDDTQTKYGNISAGGAHICGITLSDTMSCRGTAAKEIVGFAQAFPFSFLIQAAGVIGSGTVGYSKGVDKQWTGGEAGAIKVQLAMLGTSLVLSAVQSFMPKPPDPVAESLSRIEANLAELKQSIGILDVGIKVIEGKLDRLSCDTALQPIIDASNRIKVAEKNYKDVIEFSSIRIRAYIEGKEQNLDRKEMDGFVSEWSGKGGLQENINDITSALAPDISLKESALKSCMEKSFNLWKNAATHPFNDKVYYEPIYELLAYAMSRQALALKMLQEIYLYQASLELGKGGVNYSPGDMVGFCANVRSNASLSGKSDVAWKRAQVYCDQASDLTKQVYNNMVKEMELAGAPYTGDDTVLSLGSALVGKGNKDVNRNWLWVRDANAYGYTKGSFYDNSIRPPDYQEDKDFPGPKPEYVYYSWQPAGQAWMDVEDTFYHQLRSEEPRKDLPITMRDEVNFKNITDRVIWITNKTFLVDWSEMAHFYENYWAPFWWSDVAKAFVASGIGKKIGDGSHVLGIITNQWKFRWFTGRTTWNDDVRDVGSRAYDSNGYEKYTDVLGSFYARWTPGPTRWQMSALCTTSPLLSIKNHYGGNYYVCGKPDENIALTRWPVLDVSKLGCSKSMVVEGSKVVDGQQRPPINYVGAPTRCGSDLDRVINSMVPRPITIEGRIPPPNSFHYTLSTNGSGPYTTTISCDINLSGAKDWYKSRVAQFTAFDPVTSKSFSSDATGIPAPFTSTYFLANKIGNPKVFQVVCSSNVVHGETGTSYDVSTPTYQFDTTTNQLTPVKN